MPFAPLKPVDKDFDAAEMAAFKQVDPDLSVFEEMGAGKLPASVIHGDVDNGQSWRVKRRLVRKEIRLKKLS